MSVSDNLQRLLGRIPPGVQLVAVSKFHPGTALLEAYGAGQRVFGESRAAELVSKASSLPADIQWHFIGHLQTNKVRAILPHVALVHSVDSERLLRAIDSESARLGRVTPVLVQLHVAREETKYGFTPAEASALFTPALLDALPWVRVDGVMGMASNTDDTERVRADFRTIRTTFDALARQLGHPAHFATLSMGMSHDWPLAVDEGANMIRIGTDIFGQREY